MLKQQAWRRVPAKLSAACALVVGISLAATHLQGRAPLPTAPLRLYGEQQQQSDARAGGSKGAVPAVTGGGARQRAAFGDEDAVRASAIRAAAAATAAAAAATGAVVPPAAEPRSCTVDLSGSPFAEYCVPLPRACVDQGDVILHDARYQQVGMRAPDPLPNLETHRQYNFGIGVKYRHPWLVGGTKHGSETEADLQVAAATAGSNADHTRRRGWTLLFEREDPSKDGRQVRRPRLRPVSSQEPRPYLSNPRFASCTVPVVWLPHWQNNLHHTMADTVVPLYGALKGQSWAKHIKLVIQTPDGLAMEPAMQAMLDTLSEMSVETFADFSARLPEGAAAAALPEEEQRPASYGDGGPQHCFQQLFFCGNATLGEPHRPFHALGRHIVEALQASGAVPPTVTSCGAACSKGEERAVLRVVFAKRSSSARQLLNTAEILKRCQGWQHKAPSGAEYSLECSEVEFDGLFSGVAAAQQADVLIGIHGAQLSNAAFMPRGSSAVEVQPCGFKHGYWTDALGKLNAEDPSSQLQHWRVLVCDQSLCEPSAMERLGVQVPGAASYAQNRNVRLPWQAVEIVLQQILDARGDRQRYMQRYWETGKWRLFATAGATVHGACPAR